MEEIKEEVSNEIIEENAVTAEPAPETPQEQPKTKNKTNKILIFSILGVVVIALVLLTIFVFVPIIKKSKYRGNVGDIITMGTYEQDGDESNGAEEIQWIILAVDGDKELLISRYALDAQPYNSGSDENETSWETCSLRSWLNNVFYSGAFSNDETKYIQESQIESKEVLDKSSYTGVGSFHYETDNEGKEYNTTYTSDHMFLLSNDEAKQYFASNEERKCVASKFTLGKYVSCDKDCNCNWWLRDSKYYEYNWDYSGYFISGNKTLSSASASYVSMEGELTSSGDTRWATVTSSTNSIRPVMWINLE